jgi:hypothetical protein
MTHRIEAGVLRVVVHGLRIAVKVEQDIDRLTGVNVAVGDEQLVAVLRVGGKVDRAAGGGWKLRVGCEGDCQNNEWNNPRGGPHISSSVAMVRDRAHVRQRAKRSGSASRLTATR